VITAIVPAFNTWRVPRFRQCVLLSANPVFLESLVRPPEQLQAIPFDNNLGLHSPCSSVRDARHIFRIEKVRKAAKSCRNYTGAVADARLYFDSITLATIKV
jgi:hypothetical protein